MLHTCSGEVCPICNEERSKLESALSLWWPRQVVSTCNGGTAIFATCPACKALVNEADIYSHMDWHLAPLSR